MSRLPAVVRAAWTPGRAEPSHRSEMTTCWLLGETPSLLEEREAWVRLRGADGHEAWTTRGSLLLGDEVEDWQERASLVSLGTRLTDAPEGAAALAPWGSRLVPAAAGAVELPGGEVVRPAASERLVAEGERARRFPPDPAAAAATAEEWLGSPYLWGGRMGEGVDCSGLVQATFALHGIPLPRDSRDQSRSGAAVEGGLAEAVRGDLVFFAWAGRPVSHVGIALGVGRLLHASETRGCVAVDDLGGDGASARTLREGLAAVRRLPGRAFP
ncbi:MAG: C40 family peptidase [Gemmatimonadota bacterium]